jgi:hypothetical protein
LTFPPAGELCRPIQLRKPLPFVSAFVDAIDETIDKHRPGQGMSALQTVRAQQLCQFYLLQIRSDVAPGVATGLLNDPLK